MKHINAFIAHSDPEIDGEHDCPHRREADA
jgi:hypothetical protein